MKRGQKRTKNQKRAARRLAKRFRRILDRLRHQYVRIYSVRGGWYDLNPTRPVVFTNIFPAP